MPSPTNPLSTQEIETIPSRDELQQTFDLLLQSTYKGVQGVLRIDALNAQPRQIVGITALTHGNEPSGLAPFFHYLKGDRLRKLLNTGSVIFSVNNIEAAKKYFSTNSEVDRMQLRSLEVNMNRLPEDIFQLNADTRYEIRRTLELYPVLQEFDAGLDIHSTHSSTTPMIITVKEGNQILRGFPIRTLLTNMLGVQRGLPISALYGGIENRKRPVIGIEAGTHEGPEALVNATIATQSFLQNLGMIPGQPECNGDTKDIYRIARPVLFPNASYDFVKKFAAFEVVKTGQMLAAGNGPPVLSVQDGHILFPNPRGFNPQMDEAAFISDPIHTIDV